MPRERTLKIKSPLLRGADVERWQRTLNRVLSSWDVELRVKVDGVYGLGTRSVSKLVAYGLGFTHEQFDDGITSWLRARVADPSLRSSAQTERIRDRAAFRESLRQKFGSGDVAAPVSPILAMTWGWHPGIHDGIDLICGRKAPLHALCDGVVFDVRPSGWWGNSPSGEVWRGDGIIQLRCTTDEGPFRKGMHFGYGHAEGAVVREGDHVKAGALLGHAGLAVAWHVHLMANDGSTPRGIGTMDPLPFVRYAIDHA